MIDRYLVAMTESRRYRDCVHVIFIEAQMSWVQSNRYGVYIKRRFPGNTIIPSSDKTGQHNMGVTTSETTKLSGTQLLQDLLWNDRIHFADDFVSTRPDQEKIDLIREIRRYSWNPRVPKDPALTEWKWTLSGKGPGTKDDRVTSLHQCLYHKQIFETTESNLAALRPLGIPI